MADLPVQKGDFKVDTHRPKSRSKMRSKIRHVLAVGSGMFPLMAAFVYVRSLFMIAEQRRSLNLLAIVFLGCGMVTLLFYAWARAEKQRRHEVSAANRERRHRHQAESIRRERAKNPAESASAKEG